MSASSTHTPFSDKSAHAPLSPDELHILRIIREHNRDLLDHHQIATEGRFNLLLVGNTIRRGWLEGRPFDQSSLSAMTGLPRTVIGRRVDALVKLRGYRIETLGRRKVPRVPWDDPAFLKIQEQTCHRVGEIVTITERKLAAAGIKGAASEELALGEPDFYAPLPNENARHCLAVVRHNIDCLSYFLDIDEDFETAIVTTHVDLGWFAGDPHDISGLARNLKLPRTTVLRRVEYLQSLGFGMTLIQEGQRVIPRNTYRRPDIFRNWMRKMIDSISTCHRVLAGG